MTPPYEFADELEKDITDVDDDWDPSDEWIEEDDEDEDYEW